MDTPFDSRQSNIFCLLKLLKDGVVSIKTNSSKLEDMIHNIIKCFNLFKAEIKYSNYTDGILLEEKVNTISESFVEVQMELGSLQDNHKQVDNHRLNLTVALSMSNLENVYSDTENVLDSGDKTDFSENKIINTVKEKNSLSIVKSIYISQDDDTRGKLMDDANIRNTATGYDSDIDIDDNRVKDQKYYNCDKCKESFISVINLQLHLKTNHVVNPNSEINDEIHKCIECGKCLISKSSLKRHMQIHIMKNPFSCKGCGQSYKDKRSLIAHQRSHKGLKQFKANNFKCTICEKGFLNDSKLQRHILGHSGAELPYKCDLCYQTYDDNCSLGEHKLLKHSDQIGNFNTKIYKCEFCSKCFECEQSLRIHTKKHSSEMPFKSDVCPMDYKVNLSLVRQRHLGEKGVESFECNICREVFVDSGHFINHKCATETEKSSGAENNNEGCDQLNNLAIYGQKCGDSTGDNNTADTNTNCQKKDEIQNKTYDSEDIVIENKKDRIDDKFYHCKKCNKFFINKSSLDKHFITHTENSEFKCPTCGLWFKDKGLLTKHKQRFKFKCDDCKKCYVLASQLVVHERTHSGFNPYMCGTCNECFNEINLLQEHYQVHEDCNELKNKPLYKCGECERCFKNRSHYISHLRSHSGEKPYTCEFCGKSYTEKSSLNIHIRTHTGERPYKCQTCGRGFVSKTICNEHERVHSGEKCYQCSQCGKSFAQNSTLNSHMLMHTGEKPHKCSVCSMVFRHRSSLAKHMLIHTGKKPHTCDKCGKCFARLHTLKDHETSHTGVKAYGCHLCGKHFGTSKILKRHIKKVCSVKANFNNSILRQT